MRHFYLSIRVDVDLFDREIRDYHVPKRNKAPSLCRSGEIDPTILFVDKFYLDYALGVL